MELLKYSFGDNQQAPFDREPHLLESWGFFISGDNMGEIKSDTTLQTQVLTVRPIYRIKGRNTLMYEIPMPPDTFYKIKPGMEVAIVVNGDNPWPLKKKAPKNVKD